VNLLLLLGAWFAAGVLTTLLIGPRLRRAAEAAGTALEPEPVFPAGRSPLRWRLGTLGVVGLLAGSTGMAAAGALPGSAQTIAHHVLGSVGMDVPEDSAPEVVAAPATPPWGDVAGADDPTTTSELGAGDAAPTAPSVAGDPATPGGASGTGDDPAGTTGSTVDLDAGIGGDGGGDGSDAGPPSSTPSGDEPSDVPADGPGGEPSDVPPDPGGEEPPTTTTTVPSPTEPPADPGDTPTSTPSTTTTTTTTVPPADAPPAPPPPG
jgi:hypothetical protein